MIGNMLYSFPKMPKRIILVRHGESEGNEDDTVFEHVPNYKIKLNKKGRQQAGTVGTKIRGIVSDNGSSEDWKVLFYMSPSNRTWETAEGIIGKGDIFPDDKVVGIREECRLREQHFGNFQEQEMRRKIKKARNRYGKFFYRVPNGESSADVYDRVAGFVEGLWRDMETAEKVSDMDKSGGCEGELNVIIVSHGLTILVFLMKWFKWRVDQFEGLTNPKNCEYRVVELGRNGDYSLAFHHKPEELREWGLSEDMIEDQEVRAFGHDHLLLRKCLDGPVVSSDDSSDN